MKTSFYSNGFNFHITWRKDGLIGIDQNGTEWLNMMDPVCKYNEEMRIDHKLNPTYKATAKRVKLEAGMSTAEYALFQSAQNFDLDAYHHQRRQIELNY